MNKALRFNNDGFFKIVQFTDTEYLDDDHGLNAKTGKMMQDVIRVERPDLIVFTGDIIGSLRCINPEHTFREVVSVAEQCKIPWAAVFGNHDSEAGITRDQLMEIQLSHEYCVAEQGEESLSGAGNFVLKLINHEDQTSAALYFMDSGSYSTLGHVGGYDWIRRDQIEWYVAQSKKLTKNNEGVTVPSLAFFHIPLPEYEEVWNTKICYGEKREEITAPRVNSGLFTAMVEMGDVMGTFAGHDHGNDYFGELHGIRLCYGRSSSYIQWGKEIEVGARVIQLQEGARTFDTWLHLSDGSIIREQPKHQPLGKSKS
nr:metallophosphoesterase family protein [Paenibacillus sp. Marseille-Q4541]